jgi:phosphoribosylanthranilate isomerase
MIRVVVLAMMMMMIITTMNNNKPHVKICGMRDAANIRAVAALKPDFMGFIFYEQSARFVGDVLETALVRQLRQEPFGIQTIGVFVDAPTSEVLRRVEQYDFAACQLHGGESPAECARIKRESGRQLIKAFNIAAEQDLKHVAEYENIIDYALFDTKIPNASVNGGSGTRFDWGVLNAYTNKIPFFLSGGIEPQDADEIKRLSHPLLYAVDINSRFETVPGVKDIEKLHVFVQDFQRQQPSLPA